MTNPNTIRVVDDTAALLKPEPNPLQLPLVRGRAEPAPPLKWGKQASRAADARTRGGCEGLEANGLFNSSDEPITTYAVEHLRLTRNRNGSPGQYAD